MPEKRINFLEIVSEKPERSTYHVEATVASLQELHKAMACAYAVDKQNTLSQLLQIKRLKKYYLYHTCLGETYFELEEREKAKESYKRTLHPITA